MLIECIPNNLIDSNVYIVANNGEGVIIDAGCNAEKLISITEKHSVKFEYIILTHCHFDHMYYMDSIRERTGARVCIHEMDSECLLDPKLNGMALFLSQDTASFNPADILFKDGDVFECGGLTYKIIHTPGHTKGGICVLVGNNVFTGDTLFKETIGRTDFPGGSSAEIKKSITGKLYELPDETIVYPGHGNASTIGHEKKCNLYFRVPE